MQPGLSNNMKSVQKKFRTKAGERETFRASSKSCTAQVFQVGNSCVGMTAHTALPQVTLQSTEPCQECAPLGYGALSQGKE